MKSEVKKLPKSQVEITITVPYEDYKKAEKKALEQIGKEIKVDGFRSGNIPEDVVRKQVDEQTIQGATLENIIPTSYTAAIKEHDVPVIAQPKVDIKSPVKKEGDDFVYIAVVAVMPEVKVGDYKKIKVAKPKVEVKKKQIDETIDMIMDRFAEWSDVKRKAKKNDRAEVSFEGFDEKGEAIPNTASKNHPIVLGTKTMVPGFEDAVIGMEIGKEKEFTITFPKDYHAKTMQGKKVKFKLTLNRLEEKKEQKLDEAIIEKITGQKQSVKDFTKRVEEDLLSEMQSRIQREHDNNVVKEIIKITKAELPDTLIDSEIEQLKQEQKQRISQQGLTWEQYLQHIKKTEEDFAKDHRKPAEERLLARLGVTHIIRDSKLEVKDKEVDKKIDELSARYPKEQQKQFREHYKEGSDAYRNLKNNMAADLLIDMLTK
ncbi:trigger factor [Patescibacteria group bacterium]|nr:trigger factor [Patescibacteria group bacterium]MBU1683627.1 trigger factor [Patescibacteria group bacterium]MBU1934449.1 trigger factor [Patescibacteria group bacterium]